MWNGKDHLHGIGPFADVWSLLSQQGFRLPRGWQMRSTLTHRAQESLLLVLVLTLSAAWTVADPAPAEQKPAERTRVVAARAFRPADTAARATVILFKPASYELPIRDPLTEMEAEAR